MKLLNQSLRYLSVSIFAIVTIWAVIFYFNMLHEIKSSIDEGLENYKCLIIENAEDDSSILTKKYFDESFFTVKKISKKQALPLKDRFYDTMLYMQDADDEEPELEPVRMLITAFKMNGEYYELKVANSMVEEDDLIGELLYDIVWLYLSLIIGIIIINNIILKKLWRPFYHLLAELKNFRLGTNRKLPKAKTKTREFLDLEQAVNAVLQHTTETYEQQKQFIGNASHELQTPLAISRNKLELLIEDGNLQDQQAQNIAEVMSIIERLIRLNKSLLLLTKIENKQFLENQTVSLNEVIQKNIVDLEDLASFKNIDVGIKETGQLRKNMDNALANVLISNLLRNAIFHNIPKGKVQIEITENTLYIRNTGREHPLARDLIFTRFYKSQNSSSGTGLGLSIVKAISDIYDIKVSYSFQQSLHSFKLEF
ncbi:sensor histidine kinase [Zunongwangia endophytica]|uniref:histidine kinase n=1 Tax=Zunongwangia endophytica TaxID=1808945 RepID=A0ABV8H6T1_9FLAO|nr:HAMP domain-containing sensor histidine kinase [Zunongwangia endophytica]MDN3595575.1 HAMP domain-containing sensor histidine kinase [Zunongwangia endophytica]